MSEVALTLISLGPISSFVENISSFARNRYNILNNNLYKYQ